ncbi:putative phloem protein [Helianthus annuus]|nr:putative phloem protein [Helianthus annuus]
MVYFTFVLAVYNTICYIYLNSRYRGMWKVSSIEYGEVINQITFCTCRFGEVIEVLSQQVFRIKCKIESQILSPDTDYKCYLIFKLSEKCRGLHCPVKVRGLHRPAKVEGQLQQSNKETKALYFRTPHVWNIHDINQVPKQREDGWMEVNVWKFNSKDQLRNDCIHLNLKLISYEGTMSGLIVCGLEFRPANVSTRIALNYDHIVF